MNWNHVKPRIVADLDSANIAWDEARRTILTFERRKNTLRNRLRAGSSWESICESKAYLQADELLEQFAAPDHDGVTGEYHYEWVDYCTAAGICHDANLGDHLS